MLVSCVRCVFVVVFVRCVFVVVFVVFVVFVVLCFFLLVLVVVFVGNWMNVGSQKRFAMATRLDVMRGWPRAVGTGRAVVRSGVPVRTRLANVSSVM